MTEGTMNQSQAGPWDHFPHYRCHKQVQAIKIKRIDPIHALPNPDGTPWGCRVTPEDPGIAAFCLPASWMHRHNPEAGGYFVLYADGYQSYSPAEAFEGGYTRIVPTKPGFGIGQAIKEMQNGERVQRAGWNGKGMWLAVQVPDEHSKMGHPYIYMSDVSGKLFPWNPNNLDLLARDWQVASQSGGVAK